MTIEEIKNLKLDEATTDQISDVHQLMNILSDEEKKEVVLAIIDTAQQRYPDGVFTPELRQFLSTYRNSLTQIKTDSLASQKEEEERKEREKQLDNRERGFALLKDPFTKEEIIKMDLPKTIGSDTDKIILIDSMESFEKEERIDIIEQIVFRYENENPYKLASKLRDLSNVFNMFRNKNIVDTDEVVTKMYMEDSGKFRIFYNLLGINERHHFQKKVTKEYKKFKKKDEKKGTDDADFFKEKMSGAGFKFPEITI